MKPRTDIEKAIQVAALILKSHRSLVMPHIKLLKLIYMAERRSWERRCGPIIDGTVAALKHGPVCEEVYDLIRHKHPQTRLWKKYISKVGAYSLHLIRDPGISKLSPFEVETVTAVAKEFKDKSEWEVVDETHKFPEWIKNNPGDSSNPIPLRDILEAVGLADEAGELANEIEEIRTMRDVLCS